VLERGRLLVAVAVAAAVVAGGVAAKAHSAALPSGFAPQRAHRHRPVSTEPADSTLTNLGNVGQVIAGLAAIIALPFIAWQVRASAKQARLDRTADVQIEWGARDYKRSLSPVMAFLDVSGSDDCLAKIRSWELTAHAESAHLPRTPRDPEAPSACKNDVAHVLNYFEDLCQRYNLGEVDCHSVATSMGPNLLFRFLDAAWYIYWRRAVGRDEGIFGEWETVVVKLCGKHRQRLRAPIMYGRKRGWRRRSHPVYELLASADTSFRIRLLCVPPLPRQASPADWQRAAWLSELLATDDARAKLLADRRPSAPEGPGWTIVLLPRSLRDSPEQRMRCRQQAAAIKRHLDGLRPAELDRLIDTFERASLKPA
jgi:hypothetical protein